MKNKFLLQIIGSVIKTEPLVRLSRFDVLNFTVLTSRPSIISEETDVWLKCAWYQPIGTPYPDILNKRVSLEGVPTPVSWVDNNVIKARLNCGVTKLEVLSMDNADDDELIGFLDSDFQY